MANALEREIDHYLVQILNDRLDHLPETLGGQDFWQQIYRRSERHGVSPLLYWQFRHAPQSIPEAVFGRLKQSYLTTLARNRIFLSELERVLRLLCSQGIEVVLLKGALFVRSLYEELGLRPMSDLDLLLRKAAIPQAVSLLKQNGYQEPVLHQSNLVKQDVTHDVHLRLAHAPYVDLEVHWLLVGGEKFRQKTDMDWFWSRIVLHPAYPDGGVYTLSPSAHLLYLCGHLGVQHGLGSIGLLWLIDIVRFLQKYEGEVDWSDFIRGARHLSWSAAAYYTFKEVQTTFHVSPPEAVLEQLHSQITAEEEKHVRSISVAAPSRVVWAWNQFQQLDNAARLRNVIGRLFPSLAFMRERYGFQSNWQAVLGYPLRWLDLAQIFLKYLWARRKR